LSLNPGEVTRCSAGTQLELIIDHHIVREIIEFMSFLFFPSLNNIFQSAGESKKASTENAIRLRKVIWN
jgi:hypothetical protein